MRTVTIKNRTVYEVDIVTTDNTSIIAMLMWCSVNMSKKLELDIENSIAQFMTADDAIKFETEYVK